MSCTQADSPATGPCGDMITAHTVMLRSDHEEQITVDLTPSRRYRLDDPLPRPNAPVRYGRAITGEGEHHRAGKIFLKGFVGYFSPAGGGRGRILQTGT